MIFHDDKPVECCVCGEEIYAPGDYLLFDKHRFCSEQCIGMYLVDKAESIETVRLQTAYEKKMDYGDYINDMED